MAHPPVHRGRSRSVAKPVENVSLRRISRAAGGSSAGDHRGEVGEVGLAIAPGDVVLNRGDAHRRRLTRRQFGQPLGGLVEHLGALAERKPDEVPTLVPIGIEHLVGNRHHAATTG